MKYNNLIQITQYFNNETTCKEHLEKIRWSGAVRTAGLNLTSDNLFP